MSNTPNLILPYIEAAQAQKHVTHNEALRALDAVVQLSVLDRDLAAPPASPADGARYIPASGATGAWAGKDFNIAAWQDGAWAFYAPREGWVCWVADEDVLLVWTGSAWTAVSTGAGGGGGATNLSVNHGTNSVVIVSDTGSDATINAATASTAGVMSAQDKAKLDSLDGGSMTGAQIAAALAGQNLDNLARLGINATADTTNRLSLNAAASLFNHAGNGHQLKVNKNAAADTASTLYQTGFSGRAEMGLMGDDNFRFKVSPDGSTWFESILIDRSTGRVSFPSGTAGRERLTANRTYYVRTDGNDNNNGLANTAGGAFATLQKALDTVLGNLDLAGFNVTIQIGAGTYTGGVIGDAPQIGKGQIEFLGDTANPANVIVSVTGSHCFQARNGCIFRVRGIEMRTTTSGNCLYALPGSAIYFGACRFGACAAYHVLAEGGYIECIDNYTISGGAQAHIGVSSNGLVLDWFRTITLAGTPAFSTGFADAQLSGVIRAPGDTFSGSATGPRYRAITNGAIDVGGAGANFFPGNAAGTAASGGQYV